MTELFLFCDNGIVGHVHTGGQGIISSAYALFDSEANILFEGNEIEKNVTNNYGELKAIRNGIIDCLKRNITEFVVLSDSEFSVKAINKIYEATAETIKPILLDIWALIENKKIVIKWIPREANIYADYLTAEALQEYRQTKKKIGTKKQCLAEQKDIILNRRKK